MRLSKKNLQRRLKKGGSMKLFEEKWPRRLKKRRPDEAFRKKILNVDFKKKGPDEAFREKLAT